MFPVHGCSESLAGRKLKKEDYLLFILFYKKAIFRAEHRHWCFSPSLFTCPCGRGSIHSKCKTYTFYLNSKKTEKIFEEDSRASRWLRRNNHKNHELSSSVVQNALAYRLF